MDLPFDPWTSDHRAVLSTFDVTPVELPMTVSLDQRMLTRGDTVTVYYNTPETSDGSVVVVPEGGDATAATVTEPAPGSSGVLSLDTTDLGPAGYDVVLLDEDGTEVARNSLWVRSRSATVSIQTDRPRYSVGEPIEVSWDDGPANRWDWIGVYRADAADPDRDDYLLWGYSGLHDSGSLPPTVDGSMLLDGSSQGGPWPLPAGDYVVHYLLTDQYTSAGSAAFAVTR